MSKIKGIRIDCVTGKSREVELEYTIQGDNRYDESIFQLIGGVTGHEAFIIDEQILDDYRKPLYMCEDWVANMGTKNRYDKLLIPPTEMKKALKEFL